jgi:hypothetical protein
MQVRAAHLDLLEEHGRRPVVEVGGHGMRRAAAAGHVRDLRAQLVDAVGHAGQSRAACRRVYPIVTLETQLLKRH